MPCIGINIHHLSIGKLTNKSKKSKKHAVSVDRNNYVTQDPWEEQKRQIRLAMEADLQLPGVAHLPSDYMLPQTTYSPTTQKAAYSSNTMNNLTVAPVSTNAHINMDQRGEKWSPLRCSPVAAEDLKALNERRARPLVNLAEVLAMPAHKPRSKQTKASPDVYQHASTPLNTNFSRPFPPAPSPTPSKKATLAAGDRAKSYRRPQHHQHYVRESAPVKESLHRRRGLESTSPKIKTEYSSDDIGVALSRRSVTNVPTYGHRKPGSSPALPSQLSFLNDKEISAFAPPDPSAAMQEARDLLKQIYYLADEIVPPSPLPYTAMDGGDSQPSPSTIDVLTRAMRASFAIWRLLRILNFDADMLYSRDHGILGDLVAHLTAMATRVVPPKMPDTFAKYGVKADASTDAAAKELGGCVKVLFRMGAKVMLAAGCVEKNLEVEHGDRSKLGERAKLRYVTQAFEQQAMSVGMKVEGRIHASSEKDW